MKLVYALALCGIGLGCGDDKNAPPAPDAEEDLYQFDEGGESRVEYQEILTMAGPIKKARATAFFWKAKTPARYPFANIPGCTKMDGDDRFPLGMGTSHTYLDVGEVTYSGGGTPLANIPLGPNPGVDGLFRPHDGHWRFFQDNNAGPTYFGKFDALYDLQFGGSAEWPAQTLTGVHYMPSNWQLGTPGFMPVMLQANTPLTITYTTDPEVNHPEGTTLNMIAALLVPTNGGLVVECIQEGAEGFSGSITIPADMVDHARALGSSGLLARAHVSHILKELYNGETHTHQRVDFFTIWCYVTPWMAAP
jgi:hypothetical protein